MPQRLSSPSDAYRDQAAKKMMPLHILTASTWAHATSLYESGDITAEDYASLFSEIVACMCAQSTAPFNLVDPALHIATFEKIISQLRVTLQSQAEKSNLSLHFEAHVRPKLIMPS